MIDKDGFRLNVGIILLNADNRVFFAKRINQDAWQFPQGGIHENETPEEALYRELMEEVGLAANEVEVLGVTKKWLSYRLPKKFIRYYSKPICIGQKQKWYLLRLKVEDHKIDLDKGIKPEFETWQWIDYWEAAARVVSFKRQVYKRALEEFAPQIFDSKQDKTQ